MMRGGPTAVLAVLLAGVALAGCGRSASPSNEASPADASPGAPPRSIVALGDSVPRGTNCDCTPYPPLTADDLGDKTGPR